MAHGDDCPYIAKPCELAECLNHPVLDALCIERSISIGLMITIGTNATRQWTTGRIPQRQFRVGFARIQYDDATL